MSTLKVARAGKQLRLIAVAAMGCAVVMTAEATRPASAANAVYVAESHSLNTSVEGVTSGNVRIKVRGVTLKINIHVDGAAPGIEHWQHFHGFKDGRAAVCPTVAADVNHDGVIDLIETEATSGTTMVPFNGAPAAMQIPVETYPRASGKGSYNYKKTVSLNALQRAFAKTFDGQGLKLDHRVIFIHGVPPAAKLPASVASLGSIPASLTLPIACGQIERAAK